MTLNHIVYRLYIELHYTIHWVIEKHGNYIYSRLSFLPNTTTDPHMVTQKTAIAARGDMNITNLTKKNKTKTHRKSI